jgi:protein TonB
LQQDVVSIVEAARPWRTSVRRRRTIGRVTIISLWLHLTLLALFAVAVHYAPPVEEELPPPSTVAMVFEGGSKNGPTAPKPSPNVLQPAPLPTPPPVPPAPPQVAQETPVPATPAPPAAAPPASTPPAPATPAPPPSAPSAELPVPPPVPPVAMVIPRPTPLPRPTPRPPATAPRPAPRNPDAFPTPMNFSFNRPVQREEQRPVTRASARAPMTLDFSLAPRSGAADSSPFAHIPGAHSATDWRNLLSAWVRDHAYYPEQAAMNGEDGSVMVQVTANPDGHVTSVQLESRSGSQWLDMALMGMFRDAKLPPPLEDEPITFNFTMHYILIRQ